ncbi:MAG: hypothetical protein M3383_08955 [Actinomycetota bacterium]|nr:hypothetical protein [Actinomycetota bacterium]
MSFRRLKADDQHWRRSNQMQVLNTLAMSDEELAFHYPDGPKALPPELE